MEKQTMHAAINDVKITSGLLGRVSKLVKEQVLPYQWDILNDVAKDAGPDHSILVWQKVMMKVIQVIVLQTLRLQQEEKRATSMEWFFKTVILRNGWRPLHTD